MRKLVFSVLALMSVAVCASESTVEKLPQPKQAIQILNQVILTVNGTPITQHQFDVFIDRAIKRLKESHQPMPDIQQLRSYLLDQYIDRELQLQLADRYGITANDAQIDKQIEVVASGNKLTLPQLKARVLQEGYTYPEFRAEVRKEIVIGTLQHQAVSNQITVTQEEVSVEMDKLKNDPHFGNKYQVIDMLVPLSEHPTATELAQAQQQAAQLKQRLSTGTSYKKLGNSQNNTDLGWRALSELPTLFATEVSGMKVNGVAGPLTAENGLHVIQLIAVKDSPAIPTREAVEQRLFMMKMQEQVQKWLKTIRKDADIQKV